MLRSMASHLSRFTTVVMCTTALWGSPIKVIAQDYDFRDSYSAPYQDNSYQESYTNSYQDTTYQNPSTSNYEDSSYQSAYTSSNQDTSYQDPYSNTYQDTTYQDSYSNTYQEPCVNAYQDNSYSDYSSNYSDYNQGDSCCDPCQEPCCDPCCGPSCRDKAMIIGSAVVLGAIAGGIAGAIAGRGHHHGSGSDFVTDSGETLTFSFDLLFAEFPAAETVITFFVSTPDGRVFESAPVVPPVALGPIPTVQIVVPDPVFGTYHAGYSVVSTSPFAALTTITVLASRDGSTTTITPGIAVVLTSGESQFSEAFTYDNANVP